MNLTERAQLRRLQRILQDPATDDHEARTFADLAVSLILASYEGRRFMREFRAELGTVPTVAACVAKESPLPAISISDPPASASERQRATEFLRYDGCGL